MKKTIFIAIAATIIFSCKNATSETTSNATGNTEAGSSKDDDLYFDFTVDGKELHIAAEDISSSYDATDKDTTFKIFAGKDGEASLMLIIPHNVAGPSTTPNGSPDYDLQITQGSVSLQNYPAKNFTTNSFNTTYPEMSVITPDAVVITKSELMGDKGRIITGTIKTKTYGTKDHTDPNDTDHEITGKFRIKHEFRGIKF